MSESTNVHPINKDVASAASLKSAKKTKATLTHVLPSKRLPFERQMRLLRAYAAGYAHHNKPLTTKDVSEIAQIPNTTISTANAFLLDIGAISKTDGGFIPSSAVIAFNQAFAWNPETAAQELASLLEKTWFAHKILPKVMMGAITEAQAIRDLSTECGALPENKYSLKMLLDYLEKAGLLSRQNDSYSSGSSAPISVNEDTPEDEILSERMSEQKDGVREVARTPPPSTFNQTALGTTQFTINVRVDMAEFAGWKASRITAFWNGIAQVLAAKAGTEENGEM